MLNHSLLYLIPNFKAQRNEIKLLKHLYTFPTHQYWYDSAAAVIVARKETWRRQAIWDRIQDFRDLTGIPITSHIISLVIGNEDRALEASRCVPP